MNNRLIFRTPILKIISEIVILTGVYCGEFIVGAQQIEPAALYETGGSSTAPLTGELFKQRTGWVKVEKPSALKTDTVLVSLGIAIVIRNKGNSLEVCGTGSY